MINREELLYDGPFCVERFKRWVGKTNVCCCVHGGLDVFFVGW